MVDTKTPGDKTLSVPTKTLTLKPRVETGTVRQSFSHGRTKQVVVEKRGKRRVGGDAPAAETHAPEPVVAKAPARRQGAGHPCRAASGSAAQQFRRGVAHPDRGRALRARQRACRRQRCAMSKNGAWRKKKPSGVTARKASSRPSAKPPKPAARPRKNATVRTRKPSARPNSKPRSVLARPKPGPRAAPARPRGARRAGARYRSRHLRRGRRSAPGPSWPRRRRPSRCRTEDDREAGAAEAARTPDAGHRAQCR